MDMIREGWEDMEEVQEQREIINLKASFLPWGNFKDWVSSKVFMGFFAKFDGSLLQLLGDFHSKKTFLTG